MREISFRHLYRSPPRGVISAEITLAKELRGKKILFKGFWIHRLQTNGL